MVKRKAPTAAPAAGNADFVPKPTVLSKVGIGSEYRFGQRSVAQARVESVQCRVFEYVKMSDYRREAGRAIP